MAVDPAKAYLDRLKRIPPAVAARMRVAGQQGAAEISAMQRRLAPYRDGDLQESTTYYARISTEGLTWYVVSGDDKAFYARLVEFGTPTTHAQPYFYPSYRALRRRAKARFTRAWRAGLKDSKR